MRERPENRRERRIALRSRDVKRNGEKKQRCLDEKQPQERKREKERGEVARNRGKKHDPLIRGEHQAIRTQPDRAQIEKSGI